MVNFFYIYTYTIMRVHLIKKQTLIDYAIGHPNSLAALTYWMDIVKFADWSNPNEIKKTFATADILGNDSNRVIFNIGGNKYRLICKYKFGKNKVHIFVCWIGTHKEYDKICKKNVQYKISVY